MAKSKDDLEAVRNVIEALEGFEQTDQERIIRWAKEKLGFVERAVPSGKPSPPIDGAPATHVTEHPVVDRNGTDIRSFVASKDPKNDQHFAATIAYYYQFEAPNDQRKDEIIGDDLQEACRQANRNRLQNPGQTLRNAHQSGLLDKATGTGAYKINAVGENLVAMTLPVTGQSAPRTSSKKAAKKSTSKAKTSGKKPNAKRTSANRRAPSSKGASKKPSGTQKRAK